MFALKKKVFVKKELFLKLFEYLVTETNYHPAIPLNVLVKRIKSFYLSEPISVNTISNSSENQIDINSLIESNLLIIKNKLFNYYVLGGKLEDNEAQFIYKSFQTISFDMLNGKISSTLYEYLKDNCPALTKEEFYSRYHPIMNYLLVQFKESISKEITS
jgi:hypothetical protein